MRQRLGIAQALIHKPSVLILDEPFNGLDPEGVKSVRTLFQELALNKGVAILISSHLMSEIELFCDRAVIMKQGEIKDDFSLKDVNKMPIQTSFYIDNIFNALPLLPSISHNIQIDPFNNKLTISMERDCVPELLAYLLNNQIKVFEVIREKSTLEERFMNVVGGNTIE
ncbi:ABC transporter ATP-binding protein [Paenibacillus sp. MER TA 81-3]|nr:ABC transporter ATP-binding protein [Paenibacillus sp. MER TA 81-3]